MSATGIGDPVRRKEDQRFITGKGHYTDDISRPGQTHAYFVRSPHAHAPGPATPKGRYSAACCVAPPPMARAPAAIALTILW